MLAAIAGTILAARLSSGSPNLANQLLLPAIAAVIVGGTAITGNAQRRGANGCQRADHLDRSR